MVKINRDISNVHEVKTHLSRLLERAHGGEEIILARAGKPCAKLVPLERGASASPASSAGASSWPETSSSLSPRSPEEELKAWEGED